MLPKEWHFSSANRLKMHSKFSSKSDPRPRPISETIKPKHTLVKKRKFNRSIKAAKSKLRSHNRQRECSAIRSQVETQSLLNEATALQKYVKNLSDRPLSNIEKVALGKGLKFIITPEKPKRSDLLKSIKDLKRRMRLRYVFKTKNKSFSQVSRLLSAWIPQPTYSNRLEDYLEATLTEIANLPIRNAKSNISKGELNALKAIRNDRSLVIKPFDKGRDIAILNRSDYKTEIERQLQSDHYERLPGDITPETVKMVQTTLQDMFHKDEHDEQTLEYLSQRNHKIRTPVLCAT